VTTAAAIESQAKRRSDERFTGGDFGWRGFCRFFGFCRFLGFFRFSD